LHSLRGQGSSLEQSGVGGFILVELELVAVGGRQFGE